MSDIVNNSPPKHCDLDPLPTWLLKKAMSVLTPVLCHLCNASMSAGVLPTSQKHGIVRPILKKPSLAADDLSSYRPISSHQLLPDCQSAYRRFHSTETAIAVVHNDLISAADTDRVSALVLLDLSSAFDTVDHQILLTALQRRFGIDDAAGSIRICDRLIDPKHSLHTASVHPPGQSPVAHPRVPWSSLYIHLYFAQEAAHNIIQ
jgi:hypothetical protein